MHVINQWLITTNNTKVDQGGIDKIAFTLPDVIEDRFIMVIFSLENRIKHEKLLCQLKHVIRMDLPSNVKQSRYKSFQQACNLLNSTIKESLEKLEIEIASTITEKYQENGKTSSNLLEFFEHNSSIMKEIQTTKLNIKELEDKSAQLKYEKENNFETLDQCYSSLMNNLNKMVQIYKKLNRHFLWDATSSQSILQKPFMRVKITSDVHYYTSVTPLAIL